VKKELKVFVLDLSKKTLYPGSNAGPLLLLLLLLLFSLPPNNSAVCSCIYDWSFLDLCVTRDFIFSVH
jgi:hypothetical protein